MKRLHRDDCFGWSVFQESLDLDFNSVAWVRSAGNILIDPMPMTPHDLHHLEVLGGAAAIVLTNSAHVRGSVALAAHFKAKVYGPAAERSTFPCACDHWLSDGDEVVAGLRAFALDGSKTPGELCLILQHTTLITGDLVRGHRAGAINLLPDAKLTDRASALASLARLPGRQRLDTILVGDGWNLFHDAAHQLEALIAS
jgi:Metallo-beta-lactamase superfamily